MALVDLYDPDGYIASPQHEAFAELRRTEPVRWQPTPDGDGYWMVLRHADVVTVARHPEIYSATEGGVVIENLDPERLAMMRNMLLAMDPPRHGHYRRPLADSFKARVIGELEGRIRHICRSIFAEAAERRDVDFVHDVSAYLPSQVVGELMGLPKEDWPQIHRWAEMSSGGQDPDINPGGSDPDSGDVRATGSIAMVMYAIKFAAERHASANQPDDLTTLILNGEFEGREMSDVDFGSFFNQLVTAGNDTTRTMLSSGLLALLAHPDQLAELRNDPALVPGAIEEVLRWANPLHYFRRTALRPAMLHDIEIGAGERVAMMYTSANRDEKVFDRADDFDIHRNPNPHLSFGIAGHFCLGVHLARLEGRVFFEELLAQFASIEQTGPARRQRSNLNNALKALPVRLTV